MSKITQKGYDELVRKRKELTESLQRHGNELANARAQGDLKENADYHATRHRVSDIQNQLEKLNAQIAHAVITEAQPKSTTIQFGTRFLAHVDRPGREPADQICCIVGQQEANFLEGLIDEKGPLGPLLINKKVNDVVKLGSTTITIKEIL